MELDGFLEIAFVETGDSESLENGQSSFSQPRACIAKPVVESGLAQLEALEEVVTVQTKRALQGFRPVPIRELLELADVDPAMLVVQRQRIVLGDDDRITDAPKLGEGLAEVVARSLVARLAP
jgi:hypothetical protein